MEQLNLLIDNPETFLFRNHKILLSRNDVDFLVAKSYVETERYFVLKSGTFINVLDKNYWQEAEIQDLVMGSTVFKFLDNTPLIFYINDGSLLQASCEIILQHPEFKISEHDIFRLMKDPGKSKLIKLMKEQNNVDGVAVYDPEKQQIAVKF